MSQISDAGLGHNPYAAPVDDAERRPADTGELPLASTGQRFGTFVIDYIGMTICSGAFTALFGSESTEASALNALLGVVIMLAYYIGFEAAFGKTPGKMAVGTRVVNLDGGAPSIGQVVGRTFARCVPFEALSFFGSGAVGWHDRWTKTRVIRTRD